MMITLKRQLQYFYTSRTIFGGLIIKNKYLLLSLLVLIFINFVFNHNTIYFQDINLYQLTFLTSIFYCVLLYLVYLKCNLVVRVIALLKSIPFFYSNFGKGNNIGIISIYYYIFNIILIIISLLLIDNTNNNLILLNLANYIDQTTAFSIMLLLLNVENILETEVNINNNLNINHTTMFSLFILFVLFNLYHVKINWIFDEYFWKHLVIHCDPNDDSDTDTIKEVSRGRNVTIIRGNNSSVSIGAGNTNVQVNTPNIGAAVEDTNSKEVVTVNKENVTPSKYTIKEIDKINKKFFPYLIERYTESRDNSCSDTLYNEFLSKKTVGNTSKYKIETGLTDSLNHYLDNIIGLVNSKPGMGTKELSEYIYKLHEIDRGHQSTLDEINADYHNDLDKLKAEKAVKDRQYREFRAQWKAFLRVYDEYTDNYPKKQQELSERSAIKVKDLENSSMKKIYIAAEAFRNKPSNSFSLIDYFSKNKSTQNLPDLNNMSYPETLDGKASIILNEVKRMNDLNDIEIIRMQEASDIQERFGDYSFEQPQNKQNFSRTSSQDTIKPIKPKPKPF
jgi:hypothetical protein